ncbi:hypothetical protein ACEPPN_014115 [Leptodophora sp. 'Broadleaf-Isolate-01']
MVTPAAKISNLLSPNLPATTFPHFPQLPIELHIVIFMYAAAEPQTIDLDEGISAPALLSACYISRELLKSHYITHEGRAWKPFKVTFNPTIDSLHITGLGRAHLLSQRQVRRIIGPNSGNRWAKVINQARTTDYPRSMAGVNTRACSLLGHLLFTEEGEAFMGSLQKLRLDVRALKSPVIGDKDALVAERSDWADLWEWILDSFKGVKEIEMRFVNGKQAVYPLDSWARKVESEKRMVEIGRWNWDTENALYARTDNLTNCCLEFNSGERVDRGYPLKRQSHF